ncbi:B-cell receptor CD22-like isoform X2 [Polyodon spathula]|uniref:B-cell receptor CD22-like isoform X2 n=1 Tax=Polyodon spathula TaxID=7913 RepID=UPI001B7F39B4|nr:B-cell receptor CD22-like isoform X2 [Polyodon spathula]
MVYLLMAVLFLCGAADEVIQSDSYLQKEEGSCVTVTCIFKRHSIETVIWWKNPKYDSETREFNKTTVYHEDESNVDPEFKGRAEYLGNKKNNCSFKLKNLQLSDSGLYHVRLIGNGDYKWMNKQGVNLSVTDNPCKIDIETPSLMTDGKEANLTCATKGPCEKSPEWQHIQDDWQLRRLQSGGIGQPRSETLTFTPTWKNHAQTLTCQVEGSKDECAARSILLNVQYPPKETTAISRPADDIKEGVAVTLSCSCKGNPSDIFYTWFKVGHGIIYNSEKFEFHSISVMDSGDYLCEAKNKLGAQNSTVININVKYPPTNLSLSMESDVVEGNLAVIHCTVQSNPESYLSLSHSDAKREPLIERSYNSIKLTFPSLSSEDFGLYTCRAMNSEGQMTAEGKLNVKYAPKDIRVLTPSGEIMEENTVSLNCENRANPPVSQYAWFKVTGDAVHKVGSQRALQFTSISYKDQGEYFCNARNVIGEGNSSVISLTLKFPPKNTRVLHNISAAGVTEGDTVLLVCSCLSNPPVEIFNWYRDAGNNRETPVSSFQNLIISDITKADEGLYYCVAKNALSSQMSEKITILVSYSLAVKAAISAAVLVAALSIFLAIVFICRWKQRKNTPGSQDGEDTCFKLINHMGTRNDTRENLVMDWVSDPQRSREDLSDGIHNPESLDYILSRQGRSRNQQPPGEAEVVYSTVVKPAPEQKGRGTENPQWATRNNYQDRETVNYASLQFQGTSGQQKGSAGKERVTEKKAVSDIYSTVCKRGKPTEQEKGDYENFKIPSGACKQKDEEEDSEELNYSTIVIPPRVNKWESESDEEDEEERTQYTQIKL